MSTEYFNIRIIISWTMNNFFCLYRLVLGSIILLTIESKITVLVRAFHGSWFPFHLKSMSFGWLLTSLHGRRPYHKSSHGAGGSTKPEDVTLLLVCTFNHYNWSNSLLKIIVIWSLHNIIEFWKNRTQTR